MPRYYDIRLTFCDEERNQFVPLGGASFKTKREQLAAWRSLPPASVNSDYVADFIGPNRYDMLRNRPISKETIERLIGVDIETLITKGRAKLVKDQSNG